MTFRSKLFVNFMLALLLSVALVTAGVTVATRRAFDELNRQHTDALVEQFQREFDRRGHDVLHRVQGIAEAEPTVRMAIDLSRPNADISVYVNDAHGVAQSHQLDFLDFVGTDGSIISSAEWSARFGYKMEWVTQKEDWASRGSFLMRLDTQEGPALALMAVAAVRVGDKDLYVVGGERLGKEFLASLVLPENMRALLYLNLDPAFQPTNVIDSAGSVAEAERFEPIIERERAHPSALTEKINWTFDAASGEIFHAIPKLGRQNELLGVLLIGNSQRTVVTLERHILWLAIGVAAIGILFGLFLSWWAAARVTLPVRRLAAGAREVSDGNWNTRVAVRGNDEIGQLAQSFNQMTQELVDQRERLIQAERVAAWREVARRLAHELKNPLFPLQTTVENLQRASTQNPDQFEEVFRESTGILLAEIENLKTIVGRFSDFAKMPQPELGPVDLNDIVRNVVKLFEAQFSAVGRPPITPELHLGENLPTIQADNTLLHRAIENLVLNAMDAMPAGGILMMRTAQNNGNVDFEISDTGVGLTREEADRIFTPYYTTKQHGTGLGLAIVQAIVADHSGRISVESEMGVGTAFHLELPVKPPHHPNQTAPMVVAQDEKRRGLVAVPAKAHILIIDDDANTLASLARAFRLAGHEASVCDNAARAIELAKAERFDLILSDVVMPGRDGIALLEDLKNIGVESTFVMMSGQASIEMAVRATRLGASDFLEKPISSDKLLLTVENTLRLKRLETENRDLKKRLGRHHIVWASPAMREVMAQVEQVAASETRVCIRGETGTGKELIARTLHEKSARRTGPFVSLNCAAIPGELVETELFGHEKGSFTGAAGRHIGKFEQAHRGTLFLDEIGDMPISMQAKLLRVLEEGEMERVGGDKPFAVDVRIVVATHRNLEEHVRQGTFREDLYHRVFVFPVVVPPLRERREDIRALAEHFICQLSEQNNWKKKSLSPDAIAELERYPWPGNVRELRNVIERMLLLAPEDVVEANTVTRALPSFEQGTAGNFSRPVEFMTGALGQRVEAFERETLLAELKRNHNHMTNTAKALGLERSHLYKKCQQLGIDLRAIRSET